MVNLITPITHKPTPWYPASDTDPCTLPFGNSQSQAWPQQVAEEGHGMVELHLFVVEGQAEQHCAQQVLSLVHSTGGQQGKTQTDAVVSWLCSEIILCKVQTWPIYLYCTVTHEVWSHALHIFTETDQKQELRGLELCICNMLWNMVWHPDLNIFTVHIQSHVITYVCIVMYVLKLDFSHKISRIGKEYHKYLLLMSTIKTGVQTKNIRNNNGWCSFMKTVQQKMNDRWNYCGWQPWIQHKL